ncbi:MULTISPECIES: thymidine phosphorylase [unclassified Paracoccus (in: a-proteobacteria)]|uniref:thymidine phosphorylase n=1 Tax=unclassified Paracoccus (in: a-proteobacteria) TaxID=2688777 RepID=UPI0021E0FDED|nr:MULTISPECIES: thymidine phosphorylase [unclassified Paracoccus (in: a-proteobacteria)]UXU75192.1 thymidine phosphorylase [Paracoccus sp. SMMA_5]UXU81094.1 thymidine phosphorylase [Paracoccus sp. SMMA_5_TC]
MTATDPRPVIAALRDGRGLDASGARLIAQGLARGWVSDAQAGAFAMAVLLRGLTAQARVDLTLAMRDTGRVLDWDLPGPVVDKHSTGGIGDTVSLVLAPLVAACGGHVPMISGRGLGHTGGTLDKLEAIPGLRVDLAGEEFRRVVAKAGCAIVAAGPDLAPADARLYALRDESATVGSVDLITASILSKKLAAGLDGLVLDVKQGSGAFLRSAEAAQALARALVQTACAAGCPTRALITDMDQPLARAAGNALELREAIAVLRGDRASGGLRELSLRLAQACLDLVGLDGARSALESGAAAERFARMVAAQGGPSDLIERPDRYLPPAPVIRPVPARGRVAAIDAEALGHAVVALGGGRLHAGDRIDPRVGLAQLLRIGEEAGPDRPLAMVHAASEAAAQAAIATVQAAYLLGDGPAPGPLVKTEVSGD